ncbi:hypothetical protein DPEC_G00225010 [Dallia pectoralis]|uniref:Uncharacterized protein n=1 Tax=Dallia pectoralis TaxID=75939 RepID=A0ACC2G0C1_DALPE|nr:hypothetical protein DPEC_G00225010 [Dallia pectoralis]
MPQSALIRGKVGLFQKSGVKSRVQCLCDIREAVQEGASNMGQFHVADMGLENYRDLPETVFTSTLCKSFWHICV